MKTTTIRSPPLPAARHLTNRRGIIEVRIVNHGIVGEVLVRSRSSHVDEVIDAARLNGSAMTVILSRLYYKRGEVGRFSLANFAVKKREFNHKVRKALLISRAQSAISCCLQRNRKETPYPPKWTHP